MSTGNGIQYNNLHSMNSMTSCIRTHPRDTIDDAPYHLETDTSDYTLGTVLSQKQDNKWHPVAFLSKSLNEAERNYEIYDKEMLAIMVALDEWRHHLLGAKLQFEIWTDHQNLMYFKKPQKMNRRQAQWITELQEYNFTSPS